MDDKQLSDSQLEEFDELDLLGHELWRSAQSAVQDRSLIEERWVEDYRQYLGQYEQRVLKNLKEEERSSVFVNLTRPKTDNAEGQLVDMLFPNDDKNWGISETPVPELEAQVNDQTPANMGGQEWQYKGTEQKVTVGDLAMEEIKVAKKRARLMEKEIEDQFVECDYNTEARKVIHYACILGTGVVCGPEVDRKEARTYEVSEDKDGKKKFKLKKKSDPRPVARSVLPWDFFPDLSADCIDNAEYVFERHYLTKKQVRRLVDAKKFLKERVKKLLAMEPGETRTTSSHIDELREMVGISSTTSDNRYEIWTYRGPVKADALEEAGVEFNRDEISDEVDAIVVMSGPIVLKVTVNPMESGDWTYSVYNWEEDDTCIFGYGVPYQCRDAQRIINSAWRMMLDNASKGAGPQIVLNGKKLVPQDGDYKASPWKVWLNMDPTKSVQDVFQTFNFPSMQQDLAAIFNMAQQLVNQETNLPIISQGEQGQVTPTVGGMSMLMNAANASRRNQVKGWDDNVTKPLLRRFYDWNMQFGKRDDIKGDFEVHARGTSALLIKETQTVQIMAMLDKYAAHPVLGTWLKAGDGLRKLAQAQHIPPEEIVKTQEEHDKEEEQRQAQSAQQKDPSIQVEEMRLQQVQMKTEAEAKLQQDKLAYDGQQRDMERELKRQLKMAEMEKARLDHEVKLMELAQEENTTIEKIQADLKKHRDTLDLDMSKFLTEAKMKRENGKEANYGLE